MGDDGRVCMKLSKNGKLYVTTIRMVFVASNPDVNSDFCSFDIPLSNVRGEAFNQPIFGCNNLSGTCLPLPGFSGSISWVVAFKSGGVGTLLSVLQDLLRRNRTGRPEAPEGEPSMLAATPCSASHLDCRNRPRVRYGECLAVLPRLNFSLCRSGFLIQAAEMRVMSGGVSEVGFVDPHDPTGVNPAQPSWIFAVIRHSLNSYICIPASEFLLRKNCGAFQSRRVRYFSSLNPKCLARLSAAVNPLSRT